MMQDPEYASDFEALVAYCQERNIAVQTIKSIARNVWGNRPRTAVTWYEPLTDQTAVDKAVHWALSRPGIFLNTVGDIQVLPKFLSAASRFESKPSDEEMEAAVSQQQMQPLFSLARV